MPSAQARLSGTLVTFIPFVVLGAVWVQNPNYVGLLFFDRHGQQLLGLACMLIAFGSWVLSRMVRIKE